MTIKKTALAIVFIWFFAGGVGHFLAPDFFLKIIPPQLPFRIQAVYVSGIFELAGALGLLHLPYRRAAGIGLFALTLAVTPANIYMWNNPQLFSSIPEILLTVRLLIQLVLLGTIWWATIPDPVDP